MFQSRIKRRVTQSPQAAELVAAARVLRNCGEEGCSHALSGYITPAVWGVSNASEWGTKSEVAHMWAV